MRKVHQLSTKIQDLVHKKDTEELRKILFEFLFYSPKFPLRNHQQLLLDQSQEFVLDVFDPYFEHSFLKIKSFCWGEGDNTVLLTHGWASKAIDFYHIIQSLLNRNMRVISFDAPGNGYSEGRLTNLLLYVKSIEKVVEQYGIPQVMIGHSLGVMANVIALRTMPSKPEALISLTPLINLENYFTSQLLHHEVGESIIEQFYSDFFDFFHVKASHFDLNTLYDHPQENHWLLYDAYDKISPQRFMDGFLARNKTIKARAYNHVGHENMLKDKGVVSDILELIALSFR